MEPPTDATVRAPALKFVSLHENSGYGIAARGYLNALNRRGVPLTWTPLVRGRRLGRGLGYEPLEARSVGRSDLDPLCNRPIDYDTVVLHTVPEYFPVLAAREAGKRIVGYTTWETDRLPAHWPDLINRVDHVLVPCRWNQEVFRRCGVTRPIDVVPHLVSAPAYPGPVHKRAGEPYVFYTIGTWTRRKAIWLTIQAFLRAFTANDRTRLVVKTTQRDFTQRFVRRVLGGGSRRAVQRMLKKHPHPPQVELVTDEISDEAIAALHHRGDCYVSLCRAEGFGLGAFDAASLGRPVITTGFGGQLDYLPANLAFLVPYRMIPVDDPTARRSYARDQQWADPDVEEAAELMRRVFEDREEARRRGVGLMESIGERFSERQTVDRLLHAVFPTSP